MFDFYSRKVNVSSQPGDRGVDDSRGHVRQRVHGASHTFHIPYSTFRGYCWGVCRRRARLFHIEQLREPRLTC
jgi:hypothetical protein